MRINYVLLALLGGIVFPNLALALNYNQALEQGLKNSPFAAEVRKIRLENYGAQIDETKLSNPEIEYEYNIDGKEHEVTLSQPFRLSDITLKQLSYRSILKELNCTEAKLDLLRIYHQVSRSYYDLYVLQEQKKYKQEHLKFLNKVSQTVHRSINHNNLSTAEIYAFDADILSTQTELDVLKEDLNNGQIAFARFLNISDKKMTLKQPPQITVPVSLKKILQKTDEYPSQHRMLELQRKQAGEKLEILAQDRYAPIISPKVVYGYNRQERKDDLKVGLSLSIPLWNRQDGAYSALKAKKKSATIQLESQDKVSFNKIISNAYKKLSVQAAAVNKYAKVILPDYRKSVNKMETSFANGRFTVFDVWQIREKYLNAQEQYLNALKNALEAKIELEILIGTRLEDIQ
uniref:Transporter n=1 Tax=uncultured Alphaproteobacteria bacterium TaxID=91750 RepID=A0A6G8F254_9PROT|nr:hypothetical protein PlAlph_0910 [uncultured Alphaproteobacteria bacterium]